MSRRPAVMLFVASALVAGQVSGVAAQQSSRPSGQRASDVGIGVRAGSLGAGITVSKLLVSHLGLRVGGDFFSQTFNGKKQTDITYDIKGQWNGLSALLDLYPAPRGSFHLTGGLITKPVKLTLTGVPTATGAIPINSRDYFASQVGTLTGTIDFASVEPYIGLGFGTAASNHGGLSFTFDIGAAIGKPRVRSLTASAPGATNNAQLQRDLSAQIASTQADLNKVPAYPVVAVGLMYRF